MAPRVLFLWALHQNNGLLQPLKIFRAHLLRAVLRTRPLVSVAALLQVTV